MLTTSAPPATDAVVVGRRMLYAIERRIDYLAARVRDAGAHAAKVMHHDRAELKALRWALEALTDPVVQRRLRTLRDRDDE